MRTIIAICTDSHLVSFPYGAIGRVTPLSGSPNPSIEFSRAGGHRRTSHDGCDTSTRRGDKRLKYFDGLPVVQASSLFL